MNRRPQAAGNDAVHAPDDTVCHCRRDLDRSAGIIKGRSDVKDVEERRDVDEESRVCEVSPRTYPMHAVTSQIAWRLRIRVELDLTSYRSQTRRRMDRVRPDRASHLG